MKLHINLTERLGKIEELRDREMKELRCSEIGDCAGKNLLPLGVRSGKCYLKP